MKIPVDSDVKMMLSSEFAESVMITFHDGVDDITINTQGIFDETYEQIDQGSGSIVMSTNPRVTIFEKEIEENYMRKIENDIRENWQVKVRNVNYRIKSPQRDGTGVVMLELKRA